MGEFVILKLSSYVIHVFHIFLGDIANSVFAPSFRDNMVRIGKEYTH